MTDQAIVPVPTEALDTQGAIDWLKDKYPEAVQDDTRQGYGGVVVDRTQLTQIAHAIRDDLGYDYLSSATAVDYLGISDHIEMVYHAYRTAGGPPLVFKAQTPPDRPLPRWIVPRGEGPNQGDSRPSLRSTHERWS